MKTISLEIDMGIYGKRTVQAYEKDGLCVHKTVSGKGWNVTHVASTMTVNGRTIWPTKTAAMACVDRLLALPIEWVKSFDEITNEFRAHSTAIREATALV